MVLLSGSGKFSNRGTFFEHLLYQVFENLDGDTFHEKKYGYFSVM